MAIAAVVVFAPLVAFADVAPEPAKPQTSHTLTIVIGAVAIVVALVAILGWGRRKS